MTGRKSNKPSKHSSKSSSEDSSIFAGLLKEAGWYVIAATIAFAAISFLVGRQDLDILAVIFGAVVPLLKTFYEFLTTKRQSYIEKQIRAVERGVKTYRSFIGLEMRVRQSMESGLVTPHEYQKLMSAISCESDTRRSLMVAGLSFLFNSKLLSLVTTKLLTRNAIGEEVADAVNSTVVGLMAGHKSKQNALAYVALILALAAYIGFSATFGVDVETAPVVILSALIFCIYLNQRILLFRISHDFYGTNETEARELIGFILKHADSSQFTGGDGSRVQLLPDPKAEVERLAETAGSWGEVPA